MSAQLHQFKKLLMASTLGFVLLLQDIKYASIFQDSLNRTPLSTTHYAYRESGGFFISTSNSDWEKHRHRFHSQQRHVNNDIRNRKDYIHGVENHTSTSNNTADLFYRDNYDAEFTCLNEIQLGVTHDESPDDNIQTPQWICDPSRIYTISEERLRQGGNGCVIYAFGNKSTNPIRFLQDLTGEMDDSCETHAFRSSWGQGIMDSLQTNVHFHPWGMESKSDSHLGRTDHLTFKETLHQLGHDNYDIDILSIDCDGCEWDAYNEILERTSISQLIVELHSAPHQVNDFFLEMKMHGYVVFHKESSNNGKNQVYSFIKLGQNFVEN